MKPQPVDPHAALHVARKIQRERVQFRSPAIFPIIMAGSIVFWIAVIVWLCR